MKRIVIDQEEMEFLNGLPSPERAAAIRAVVEGLKQAEAQGAKLSDARAAKLKAMLDKNLYDTKTVTNGNTDLTFDVVPLSTVEWHADPNVPPGAIYFSKTAKN
jgi:hypothetical protein